MRIHAGAFKSKCTHSCCAGALGSSVRDGGLRHYATAGGSAGRDCVRVPMRTTSSEPHAMHHNKYIFRYP